MTSYNKVNDRHNKLTLLSYSDPIITPKGRKLKRVECMCDCGSKVIINLDHFRSGHTKSCGCHKVLVGRAPKTHGKCRTNTYESYHSMLRRCNDKDNENYGGRGITVCDRWNPVKGGCFENFLEDMGECPPKLSIDRIDGDGNYEPKNCRWATQSTQCFNKNFKPNRCNFRGVSLNLRLNKYVAYITCKGSKYHLGCFDDIEDAKKARKAAEIKYFGENHK